MSGQMLAEKKENFRAEAAQKSREISDLRNRAETVVLPQTCIDELKKGAEQLLASKDQRLRWYGMQANAALGRNDAAMALSITIMACVEAKGYLSNEGMRYAEAVITGKADANTLAAFNNELSRANFIYQIISLGDEIAEMKKQTASMDVSMRKFAELRINALEDQWDVLKGLAIKSKNMQELGEARGKTGSILDDYAKLLCDIDNERKIRALCTIIPQEIKLNDTYMNMIRINGMLAESAMRSLARSSEIFRQAMEMAQQGIGSDEKSFAVAALLEKAVDLKTEALVTYAPLSTPSMLPRNEKEAMYRAYGEEHKAVLRDDVLFGTATSSQNAAEKLKKDLTGFSIVELSVFSLPRSQEFARTQEAIRTAVKNGDLAGAQEILNKAGVKAQTQALITQAIGYVTGFAAFFVPEVGPWISTGIFSTMSAENAMNEYRRNGRVSAGAWAMLGLSVIPGLGTVKGLRAVAGLAAIGGLGWGGYSTYQLWDLYAKTTDKYDKQIYLQSAIFQSCMMLVPLAIGGPAIVKGAKTAVPEGLARVQRTISGIVDEINRALSGPERAAYALKVLTSPEAMDLTFRPRMTGKADMEALQRKAGLGERVKAAREGFKRGKAEEEPKPKSEEEIAREKATQETQKAREAQESDFLKTARQGLVSRLEAGEASSLAEIMKALYARAGEKGCPRNVQEQCYQEMGRLASYEKARAGMAELAKTDAVLGQALRRADIAIREGAGKSQLEAGQFMRSQAKEGPGEEGMAFIIETIERPTAQRNARLIMEFTELQGTRIPQLQAKYAKTRDEAAKAKLDKATTEMNDKYAEAYAPQSRPFVLSERLLGIEFNAVQKAAMLRRFMQHELTTKLTAKKPGQTSGIFHKSAILDEAEANPEIAAQLADIIGETTGGARQRVGIAGTEFGTVKAGLAGWMANSFPVRLAKGGWEVFKWAEWNSWAKGRKILEETPAEKTAKRASGYAWMAWQGAIWGTEAYLLGFGGQRIGPWTTPGLGLVPTALNVFTHEKDVKAATLKIEKDYGVTVRFSPDNAKFLMSREGKEFYTSIPGNYPSPKATQPALESTLNGLLEDKRIYLDPARMNDAIDAVRAWRDKNGKVPTFRDMEAIWLSSGAAKRMPRIVAEDFLLGCRVEVEKDDPRAKYLVAHQGEFKSLWNAVQRGNIPMVYVGNAIDELMKGGSFESLRTAGYYIELPAPGGLVSGIRYNSLLGTLDMQAFYDPDMAPVVRSVLRSYKDKKLEDGTSAMQALNEFVVPAGYVVYGNPAQLAAMITKSSNALKDAQAEGLIGPGAFAAKDPTMVCYTYKDQNGSVSRSYGSAEVRFVMKYSEEMSAGLGKWISDNADHIRNGVTDKGKGYLRMIVEDLEATMPPGTDAQGAYEFANRRATSYKERGYWIGMTPDEAKARKKIPTRTQARGELKRQPIPARVETEDFAPASKLGEKIELTTDAMAFWTAPPDENTKKFVNLCNSIITGLCAGKGKDKESAGLVQSALRGKYKSNQGSMTADIQNRIYGIIMSAATAQQKEASARTEEEKKNLGTVSSWGISFSSGSGGTPTATVVSGANLGNGLTAYIIEITR